MKVNCLRLGTDPQEDEDIVTWVCYSPAVALACSHSRQSSFSTGRVASPSSSPPPS